MLFLNKVSKFILDNAFKNNFRVFSKLKMSYTVAVEGNVGSGKTTFLHFFSKFPNTMILEEPVTKWRDVKGYNLLDLMYRDPSRWSLTFQTYVQLTMLKQHELPQSSKIKFMERSIFSARYCFVENLYQQGLMPIPEYIVLDEWFQYLVQRHTPKLDLIVYLRTEPEVVYERIKNRNRQEEMKTPLDYFKKLHDLHEDWLYHKAKFYLPAPVLTLDANANMEEMEEQFNNHAKDILFKK